jgi:hypothetical protein
VTRASIPPPALALFAVDQSVEVEEDDDVDAELDEEQPARTATAAVASAAAARMRFWSTGVPFHTRRPTVVDPGRRQL